MATMRDDKAPNRASRSRNNVIILCQYDGYLIN